MQTCDKDKQTLNIDIHKSEVKNFIEDENDNDLRIS